MLDVIGVSFQDQGRIYYFSPQQYHLKKNITVIVKTDRGLQFGKTVTDPLQLPPCKINGPLQNIIRIATKQDYQNHRRNLREADDALAECKNLVKSYQLPMQIIDCSYTFDRSQLMFHFLSEKRVDFRTLAKDLASKYRTRIELRQVGVRDKAKEIGGIGQCGLGLCCAKFLHDFESVSINMAKNQNLSLNPSKINGVCGRLLCCLKYEEDCYEKCRQGLPEYGKRIMTPKGEGKVVSVDILKESYKVEIPEVGVCEFHAKNGSD